MKRLLVACAVLILLGMLAVRYCHRQPPDSPSVATATISSIASESPLLEAQKYFSASSFTNDATANRAYLADLRRTLRSLPRADAVHILMQFLDSGIDAATGLRFQPGAGGMLLEAPTLRVFALDLLGELAPEEAARISRPILDTRSSQDEWAIALRNAHSALPDPIHVLAQALDHAPWVASPTSGLLHTLDLISLEGDTRLLPRVEQLRTTAPSAWRKASTVSLHRLASLHPQTTFRYINEHPTWLGDSPLIRADLFASADLSDLTQLQLIEPRLADPGVSYEEKEKLLLMLASPGYFLNEGLFTRPGEPPSAQDYSQRDAQLLRLVDEWSARFPELHTPLQELREFLAESQ